MTTERWPVPHSAGEGVRHTRPFSRVVLVVVHGVASGRRLCDAITAVEALAGVQVVFTTPPGPPNGADEFLMRAGALITTWERASQERFDLVVSASPTGIDQLAGPVLLLPSFGAKGQLVDHHGRDAITAVRRVLYLPSSAHRSPLVIGVPRHRDLELLRHASPDVGQHGRVVGDPSFDRVLLAMRRRTAFRSQLGVRTADRLGLLLSSRGPRSLFGRSPAELRAIARADRRRGDRLFCSLHPDVWTSHGARQVHAWTAEASRDGLVLVPPHDDWRPLLAAADYVIGDHGVATSYATALGKSVRLVHQIRGPLRADPADPLVPVSSHLPITAPDTSTSLVRVTSVPLRSTALIESLAVRLLDLRA